MSHTSLTPVEGWQILFRKWLCLIMVTEGMHRMSPRSGCNILSRCQSRWGQRGWWTWCMCPQLTWCRSSALSLCSDHSDRPHEWHCSWTSRLGWCWGEIVSPMCGTSLIVFQTRILTAYIFVLSHIIKTFIGPSLKFIRHIWRPEIIRKKVVNLKTHFKKLAAWITANFNGFHGEYGTILF